MSDVLPGHAGFSLFRRVIESAWSARQLSFKHLPIMCHTQHLSAGYRGSLAAHSRRCVGFEEACSRGETKCSSFAHGQRRTKAGKKVFRSRGALSARRGLLNLDAFELTTHATLRRSQTRRGRDCGLIHHPVVDDVSDHCPRFDVVCAPPVHARTMTSAMIALETHLEQAQEPFNEND